MPPRESSPVAARTAATVSSVRVMTVLSEPGRKPRLKVTSLGSAQAQARRGHDL